MKFLIYVPALKAVFNKLATLNDSDAYA
jgi:hypothetical protein